MSQARKLKTAQPERWTEAKVFDQLRHIFPSPAHVCLPSVRNGVGYTVRERVRTADAIVFSTWPSRGLWMAGVEIKVSKSDWKKELSQPDKSDEIQQYCNYWYVAVPAGLVNVNEVPETWGLVEVKSNTACISKPAPRLDAKPIDLPLCCSIFRAMEGKVVPAALVNERIAEAEKLAREDAMKRHASDYSRLLEVVREFQAASGIKLDRYTWRAGNIGKAVKLVMDRNVGDVMKEFRKDAENAKRQIDDILKSIDAPPETEEADDFDDEDAK